MTATANGVGNEGPDAEELRSIRTSLVLFATIVLIAGSVIRSVPQFSTEAQRAPRLAGWTVLSLALLGLVRYLAQLFRTSRPSSALDGMIGRRDLVGVSQRAVLLVGLYVFALVPLGFAIASALFVFALAALLRDGRDLVSDAVFGIGAAVAVWAVFVPLLGVRLPRSPFSMLF